MKKIFALIALTLSISTLTFAQKKGEMSIGGAIGFGTSLQTTTNTSGSLSEKEKQPGSTSFNFGPEFSYFVANNCRLTVGIGYNLESTPLSKDNGKWLRNNLNLFGIGAGFSYFVNITERFHYTPGIYVSGVFGKDKYDLSSSSSYSLGAAGVDLRLNLAAFQFRPTKHFAFDISAVSLEYGYIALKDKSNTEAKTTVGGLNFDIAFQPQVGFHYYF